MMANFRAALKFSQFLFWCALLIPPQILIVALCREKYGLTLPHFFHKVICHAFGLKVQVQGTPYKNGQVLFVGNHVSYLDIPVISAVLPVSFVAKADVAAWPLFGLLAKLQQTAFINRARHAAHRENHALQHRMKDGENLVLFPEGTSSDGRAVLPFKSSLFAVALASGKNGQTQLQPFTIEIVEIDGHDVTSQQDRDMYAWHGNMTLMPHFWNFATLKGAKVRLHFHEPIQVKEDDNRKNLAKICQEIVASALPPEKEGEKEKK